MKSRVEEIFGLIFIGIASILIEWLRLKINCLTFHLNQLLKNLKSKKILKM
jgi:hypothetical protein